MLVPNSSSQIGGKRAQDFDTPRYISVSRVRPVNRISKTSRRPVKAGPLLIPRRPRRAQSSRERHWSVILADFHRSELTDVEFCQFHRISIRSFRERLYRLQPELPRRRSRAVHTSQIRSLTQAVMPAPLPVHVHPQFRTPIVDDQVAQSPSALELILVGARVHIRVSAGFDPASLRQLLNVLKQFS